LTDGELVLLALYSFAAGFAVSGVVNALMR
jgi:hypothetical protein